MANEVATQEKEIKYLVCNQEIVLTPSLIRKYLVRGKGGPFTTAQEIAFFVGLCKARQMNPWAGDCYVMKYGKDDPAAIITSIDFVRSRARENEDCQGWRCGVIVSGADGKPRDSSGLVLEGEKILGGWAECQPKNWLHPMRLEVNLAGYIKKTFDGKITKFWQPENQPTMIAKVAEMQILRRIWPAAGGKMYLAEEVGGPVLGEGMDLDIDMDPAGNAKTGTWEPQGKQPEPESVSDKFKRLAQENGISDITDLKKLLSDSAKATKRAEDDLMAAACTDFPAFLGIYNRSLKKRKEREEMGNRAAKPKKKESPKANAPPPDLPARGAQAGQGPFPEEQLTAQAGEMIGPGTGEVFPDEADSLSACLPVRDRTQTGNAQADRIGVSYREDRRPNSTMIPCPNEGKGGTMVLGYCKENCISKMDCGNWKL